MKKILMLSLVILVTVIFSGCFQGNSNQENKTTVQGEVDESSKAIVYFFWGDGCPHCEKQKPFLEEMENRYPELKIKSFEVYKDKENLEIFKKMAEAYEIQAQGVPATFIGDSKPIIGYKEDMNESIEKIISDCVKNGCADPGNKIE